MSPDDPRHGTYAGGSVHRADLEPVCEPCRLAEARYENARQLDILKGKPRTIPAIGSRRRIQSLVALGHTFQRLGQAMGMTREGASLIAHRPTDIIQSRTAAKVATLYDTWSMTLPPLRTSMDRRNATYARTVARRNEWPPPLAWPEGRIDDPDYEPRGWEYAPPDRGEQLADMDAMQMSLSEVCRRLKWSAMGLEKWCDRHGQRALFGRLKAREHVTQRHANQWGESA